MALTSGTTDTSAAAAARQLRREARHAINTLEADLLRIAAIVQAHTKSVIGGELSGDAGEFAAFYDAGRALVLAHKPGAVIPTRASLP